MTTERRQIYKCQVCGIITEILDGGAGELVCCGQPMELLTEKAADAGTEKHVPVIEPVDGGVKVIVGSTPHPMEETHYIEWIEIVADGKACRQFLKPGDAPEATFAAGAEGITAREHCTVHGLWKS